jgi:hypothetical protein
VVIWNIFIGKRKRVGLNSAPALKNFGATEGNDLPVARSTSKRSESKRGEKFHSQNSEPKMMLVRVSPVANLFFKSAIFAFLAGRRPLVAPVLGNSLGLPCFARQGGLKLQFILIFW